MLRRGDTKKYKKNRKDDMADIQTNEQTTLILLLNVQTTTCIGQPDRNAKPATRDICCFK
jgi:hypothetical protein